MKVKLLKKVRKRYRIYLYAKGTEKPYFRDGVFSMDTYLVGATGTSIFGLTIAYSEEARNALLQLVKHKYRKYSKFYKKKPIQIWP